VPDLLRRQSFLLGVVLGAATAAAGVAALIAVDALDAEAVYVETAPRLRAWDTQGHASREEWRPLNRTSQVVGDPRHLVIDTGSALFRYAGTPDTPAAFGLPRERRRGGAPGSLPPPAPDPAYRPPPARVTFRTNLEMEVVVRGRRVTQRVVLRAAARGYATELVAKRAPAPVLPVTVALRPFVVTDTLRAVASSPGARSRWSGEVATTRPYLVALHDEPAPFVMAVDPASLLVAPDPLGQLTRVELRARGLRLRAYLGILPLAGRSAFGVVEGAREPIAVPPQTLVLLRGTRGWRGTVTRRRTELRASTVAALPYAGGNAGVTALTDQALSTLAAL